MEPSLVAYGDMKKEQRTMVYFALEHVGEGARLRWGKRMCLLDNFVIK